MKNHRLTNLEVIAEALYSQKLVITSCLNTLQTSFWLNDVLRKSY